ncbi:carbon starvation protein A [Halobacteriales archaeon QH_1_68_42]|nr:MAG: carbon starvation protein A [Halobacteriales archaeon QH_1_68_42]
MVQVMWMAVAALVTFSVGYVGYSRYLARFVELDDDRETPAHKYDDGQEYVPSKKPVLLGHHYSSIAGGAPIAGPITAAAAFGWLPAIIWIAVGNPIFGAVHDFMALSSSVRHEGKSIGYIIGQYVGERGKKMLLWFAYLTIILVIAAFAYLIGAVLDAFPSAATASIVYIALAILFGVYLYQLDGPFLPGAVAFVAMVFGGVWVGLQYPLALFETARLPADTIVLFGSGGDFLPLASAANPNFAGWVLMTVIYAFAASVLPVWVLLQPRDFLTSSLLYTGVGGMILAAIVGTVIGFAPVELNIASAGIEGVEVSSLTTQISAWNGFFHGSLGPLFPFLFVTIACGTISGFHSLVSSGTTAKQLDKETDARLIGYGGMLGEGLLGVTFVGLVFVSFLLTSTDTAMRLGRYMLEEIVGTPETGLEETVTNRYVNAGILSFFGYLLVASGTWSNIWPLFGGANQALAALALLVATVWLANWDDSKQLVSTGAPLVFMLLVTVIALLWIGVLRNPSDILAGNYDSTIGAVSLGLQSVIALVLVGLILGIVYYGFHSISDARDGIDRDAVVGSEGGPVEPSDD